MQASSSVELSHAEASGATFASHYTPLPLFLTIGFQLETLLTASSCLGSPFVP